MRGFDRISSDFCKDFCNFKPILLTVERAASRKSIICEKNEKIMASSFGSAVDANWACHGARVLNVDLVGAAECGAILLAE